LDSNEIPGKIYVDVSQVGGKDSIIQSVTLKFGGIIDSMHDYGYGAQVILEMVSLFQAIEKTS